MELEQAQQISSRDVTDAVTSVLDYSWNIRSQDLPATVIDGARSVLLDQLGLIIGARAQPIADCLRQYLALSSSAGKVTSICDYRKVNAATAAFANGSMSHDLELDDIHQGSSLHVAAVLVPAALAVAEEVGASSDDLFLALVRGYEVACRVSELFSAEPMYQAGFHPTAVLGAIGAAAVAASLYKLPREQFHRAIYLAPSLSSGIMACKTEPDHFTKSFQCGVAARHGVLAAQLAPRISTSDAALAASFLKVGQAYGDDSLNPQAMTKGMGREYEIMRTSFKLYPCCRHIHPLLDALGEMRQTMEIAAEDVKSAKLALYTRGAINVGDHALRTHNARYAMAMALEHRVLQRDYFSESFDIEPMLPLIGRIELYGDPELDRDWPGNAPGVITLQMRDGSEHTNRVDYAKGTPENPIVPRELLDKFNSVTAAFVAPGPRAAISNLILQSSFDVTDMMGLLTKEQ